MPPVTYGDLLAHHTRGGFAWTRVVSQRIGAVVAVAAVRRDVSPAAVTVASLVVGLTTSAVVLWLAEEARWAAGVVAFVGWQLAYGLDCADGQVARATGSTSAAGARLDVTVDFATKLGMVVALAPSALAGGLPVAAVAAAGMAWAFPLFDEVSGRDGDAATATVDRGSIGYRLLGAARDAGVHKGVAAVGIGVSALASAVVLTGLGAFCGLLLLARIMFLVRRSGT